MGIYEDLKSEKLITYRKKLVRRWNGGDTEVEDVKSNR